MHANVKRTNYLVCFILHFFYLFFSQVAVQTIGGQGGFSPMPDAFNPSPLKVSSAVIAQVTESHRLHEQVAHLVHFTIKTQCLDSCSINVTVMSLITEEKAEKAYRITPLSHNLRPVSLPVSIDTPPKEFQHFLCKVL